MQTRNYADVIRAKMAADPELRHAVEEAAQEAEREVAEYLIAEWLCELRESIDHTGS